jgi:hypothetical protein
LKRFLALSRLWITGLKPGVNEMRDFQTFEAKPVWQGVQARRLRSHYQLRQSHPIADIY